MYQFEFLCKKPLNDLHFRYNLFFDVSVTHENITDIISILFLKKLFFLKIIQQLISITSNSGIKLIICNFLPILSFFSNSGWIIFLRGMIIYSFSLGCFSLPHRFDFDKDYYLFHHCAFDNIDYRNPWHFLYCQRALLNRWLLYQFPILHLKNVLFSEKNRYLYSKFHVSKTILQKFFKTYWKSSWSLHFFSDSFMVLVSPLALRELGFLITVTFVTRFH